MGKRMRAIVAGGANLDIQGMSRAPFLAADSNPGRVSRHPGGVGRNIAENLSRLGWDLRLLAAFGTDPEGDWLVEDCRSKCIDPSLSPRTGLPTPSYLCLLDPKGFLVGAVADMEAMEALDPSYFESVSAELDEADWIVADANLRADSLAWLASRYGRGAEGRHCKLCLDPVSATKALKAAPFFGAFDCAKPNRAEAFTLAGIEPQTGLGEGAPASATRAPGQESGLDAALRAVRALAASSRLPPTLYISLGPEGIYCAQGAGTLVRIRNPEALPAPVNGSGAGDAALAALLWAEAEGYSPADRAEFALAASALTVAAPEPVSPTMSPEALEKLRRSLFSKEEMK